MFDEVVVVFRDVVLPLAALLWAVVLWYKRDRRKSIAETAVVERTVDADVNLREAGGLGASVAFVNEAFRLERESYLRRIADQDNEITSLRTKVEELNNKLETAMSRIERLEKGTTPK